jgi:hypothetical protein
MRLRGRRRIDRIAAAASATVKQNEPQNRHGAAERKRRQVTTGGKARPYLKRRRGFRPRPMGNEIALVGIADYEISATLLRRRKILRCKRLLTQYEDIVSIASHRT